MKKEYFCKPCWPKLKLTALEILRTCSLGPSSRYPSGIVMNFDNILQSHDCYDSTRTKPYNSTDVGMVSFLANFKLIHFTCFHTARMAASSKISTFTFTSSRLIWVWVLQTFGVLVLDAPQWTHAFKFALFPSCQGGESIDSLNYISLIAELLGQLSLIKLAQDKRNLDLSSVTLQWGFYITRWLDAGLHDKIISQGVVGHRVYVGIRRIMAAILRDSIIAVAFAVVVRTHPRAIPLAMITTRKSIHGFPFLSYMGMGLRLEALRAAWVVLHSNSHVPCNDTYMARHISMYLALCHIPSTYATAVFQNWQRLLQLPKNLPIVFKLGKINKIRFVSCQKKAAFWILFTKNGHLVPLFNIFFAFVAENSFFKTWQTLTTLAK